jgi:site-specific recombinase XerD
VVARFKEDIMLEQFFGEPRAIERARASISGPYLDGFSQWLGEVGYASSSIQEFLRTAVHLGLWAEREQTPIGDISEASIDRFRLHLGACRCPGPRPPRREDGRIATRAERFLQYLRDQGIARAACPSAPDLHPLIVGFETWMRQHRGATATTLRIYRRIVTEMLAALGDDPARFDTRGLRGFVLDRSRGCGRSKAKLGMTAVRAFLRFLIASGACRPGLEGAIPTIASWRLASLPRYLSSSDVDRVIATRDSSTSSGSRDRAILLLLARLGLRAGEVATLRFEDLDWRHATIAVAGKSRRATRLPLPQEVGDAILAYLPHRPKHSAGRVFLRAAPPWGPIAPGTVSSVAASAIRAAGVVTPARGAHVLRHSAASELLRQGASLDQVRLLLRHQDLETTRLYAKVDLALLRRIAQQWPEVTP